MAILSPQLAWSAPARTGVRVLQRRANCTVGSFLFCPPTHTAPVILPPHPVGVWRSIRSGLAGARFTLESDRGN